VAWGLARISSRELAEWAIFYQSEPFGEARADVRSAIIASVVANSNRDPKKRKKAFTIEDFIPKFGEQEKRQQGWEEQLQNVQMLNEAFGGVDERKKSV